MKIVKKLKSANLLSDGDRVRLINTAFENFLNKNSSTYGNPYKSAKKAGLGDIAARDIENHPIWIERSLRFNNFVSKAEKNVDEFLDIESEDPRLLKIKQDASFFIMETVGRDIYDRKPSQAVQNFVQINNNPDISKLFKEVKEYEDDIKEN